VAVLAAALFNSVGIFPTAAAARAASPDCGDTIRKPDGTRWICTLADDFNGRSLNTSTWSMQRTAATGLSGGGECVLPNSKNVSVRGGYLRLTARKESRTFTCESPYGNFRTRYSSGGVTSFGKFSQAYGRFAFRAAFPDVKVSGLHVAFWLYPTRLTYGEWPGSGEIDIAEFYSAYHDRVIPYVHYNVLESAAKTVTNWFCMVVDTSSFHTYTAEWTRTGIVIAIDGVTCVDHRWSPQSPLKGSQPFDQPFAVIVTQVLGGASNPFTASTPLPATTRVDWVRVWK